MKQYYETMAQLRHWRRDISEFDNVDDNELRGMKCPESIHLVCVIFV